MHKIARKTDDKSSERSVRNGKIAGAIPPSPINSLGKSLTRKLTQISATNQQVGLGAVAVDKQAVKSFACEYCTKTAYEALKAELEAQLPYLPKQYLVDIRKQVTAQFVKRFRRSLIPKYWALNKGFTEQDVGAFFRAIDSQKFHLLFPCHSSRFISITRF